MDSWYTGGMVKMMKNRVVSTAFGAMVVIASTGAMAPVAANAAPAALNCRPITETPEVSVSNASDNTSAGPSDTKTNENATPIVGWQRVSAEFNLPTIAAGHCAGDTLTIAFPQELQGPAGQVYDMKDANGDIVAKMQVSDDGRSMLITLVKDNVTSLSCWLQAQIDGDITPNSVKTLTWTVNNTSVNTNIPIGDATCDATCQGAPLVSADKHGDDKVGDTFTVTISTPTAVGSDKVFTIHDTLTSPGQYFDCANMPTIVGDYFAGRDQWGVGKQTGQGSGTTVSCTPTDIVYTMPVPAGSWADTYAPVHKVSGSTGPWSDTVTLTTPDGGSWSTQATVTSYSGGGTGATPPSVRVGDVFLVDTNANGVQDAGDTPIVGATITLTHNGQPVTDVNGNVVQPVKTDANGYYVFTDLPVLPVGDGYTTTTTLPSGYTWAKNEVGTDRSVDYSNGSVTSTGDLSKDGASDMSLDFGVVKVVVPPAPPAKVSVGDVFLVDTNNNGIQDAGDTPIVGATMTLTYNGKPVTDVNGVPVAPVKTDSTGYYVFKNLPVIPVGSGYTVTTTLPSGYTWAKKEVGTNSAVDYSNVTVTSKGDLSKDGASDMTLDFGVTKVVVPPAPVYVTDTRLVQVDTLAYTSAWFANKWAALAADGVLKPGEGKPLWSALGAGKLARETATIIPVSVRHVKGTTVSKQQWADAVAKQVGKGAFSVNPKFSVPAGSKGTKVMAFMLGAGATKAAPFGPKYNISQTFIGHN